MSRNGRTRFLPFLDTKISKNVTDRQTLHHYIYIIIIIINIIIVVFLSVESGGSKTSGTCAYKCLLLQYSASCILHIFLNISLYSSYFTNFDTIMSEHWLNFSQSCFLASAKKRPEKWKFIVWANFTCGAGRATGNVQRNL